VGVAQSVGAVAWARRKSRRSNREQLGAERPPRRHGFHWRKFLPNGARKRLLDDAGEEIFIRYKRDPSKARYEFIRDYLDFKLKRIKPQDEAAN
jgi:hypothetical protein